MTFKSLLAGAMLLALAAYPVTADIRPNAPPAPPPPADPAKAQPQIRVTVGGADKTVRLRIPRSMVNAAKADAGNAGGDAAAAARWPTIMIGTALAAAITLGGLRLASRRRSALRTLAVVLAVGAAVAGSGAAWANRAPFSPREKPVPVPVPPTATYPVVVELTDGDAVEMRISGEQVAGLTTPPPASPANR